MVGSKVAGVKKKKIPLPQIFASGGRWATICPPAAKRAGEKVQAGSCGIKGEGAGALPSK